MTHELERKVAKAKRRTMSRQERDQQRINFAYGNAPDEDASTVETVRIASEWLKASKKQNK